MLKAEREIIGQGWEGELWAERTVENQRIRHVVDAEALKNDGRKSKSSLLYSLIC